MQCSSTSYLPGTWSRRSQLRCSSLPTVLLTRAARHSDRDLILFCPAVEDLDVVLSVVFVSVLGTRADTPYEAHRALLGQAMVGEPRAEGKKDCPGSIFMSFYAFRGGTWCTVSCSWRGASIASLATIESDTYWSPDVASLGGLHPYCSPSTACPAARYQRKRGRDLHR